MAPRRLISIAVPSASVTPMLNCWGSTIEVIWPNGTRRLAAPGGAMTSVPSDTLASARPDSSSAPAEEKIRYCAELTAGPSAQAPPRPCARSWRLAGRGAAFAAEPRPAERATAVLAELAGRGGRGRLRGPAMLAELAAAGFLPAA